MVHILSVEKELFEHSWNGYKPWMLQNNDRNFQSGDDLELIEVDPEAGGTKTGRVMYATITMIPSVGPAEGLLPGYVIMTIGIKFRKDHHGIEV